MTSLNRKATDAATSYYRDIGFKELETMHANHENVIKVADYVVSEAAIWPYLGDLLQHREVLQQWEKIAFEWPRVKAAWKVVAPTFDPRQQSATDVWLKAVERTNTAVERALKILDQVEANYRPFEPGSKP